MVLEIERPKFKDIIFFSVLEFNTLLTLQLLLSKLNGEKGKYLSIELIINYNLKSSKS